MVGEEDRRQDTGTRARLDEISHNYDRFSRTALWILFVLTASIFAFGILSLWLTFENRNRQKDIARLVTAIQNERQENVLTNCGNQNSRHDNTVAVLNKIAADIVAKDPSKAAAVKRSVAQNIFLINALAPRQNCRKVLAIQVKTAHDQVPLPQILGK